MEERDLEKERERALYEELERGTAFEEMLNSKGWRYLSSYYQERIKRFANSLLLEDTKDITAFEAERREIIGLRKLIGQIDSAISTLNEQRKKDKETN